MHGHIVIPLGGGRQIREMMMARYFVFDLDGVTARARLHENDAPMTCVALWDRLPFSGSAGHAMLSGTSIALYIDPAIVIPEENATSHIQTGDLMFTHYRERERHGFPEALSEIYWAYDRYCRPTAPGKMTPVLPNVFGEFVVGSGAFFDLCRRMRREGSRQLTITGATD
jgi:hypothetical protein